MVLNENGVVETAIRYDAFGNRRTNSNYCYENWNETANLPRFTFSTKECLSDAKLYLYAYRAYDPIAGRWTQRDPIDYQDSINLYQFCGNNPVNKVDRFGLAQVTINYRKKNKNGKIEEKSKTFENNTSADEIYAFMEQLPDNSITLFKIVGHGDQEEIHLDDESGDTLGITDDGRFASAEYDFTDILNKKMNEKDGVIYLKGCNTAKGDNNITKKLSTIFPNIRVKGAFFYILGSRDGGSFAINTFPKTYKNRKRMKFLGIF